MTEHEVISLAIESMQHRRALCEPGMRLYERYGEELAGDNQRREARAAAILYAQLTEAINMLQAKL